MFALVIFLQSLRMIYKYYDRLPHNGTVDLEGYKSDFMIMVNNTKKALQLALQEKDRQKDNPLYENDMVVWDRAYLGANVCFYMVDAFEGFKNKDTAKLDYSGKKAIEYLNRLELLLSRRSDYSLRYMFDYVMKVPGTNKFTPRMIRSACTGLGDYNVNDIYEQIRFYYRPRLEKYFALLKDKASRGEYTFNTGELNNAEFVRKFIDNPLIVPDSEKYQGSTMQFIIKEIPDNSN